MAMIEAFDGKGLEWRDGAIRELKQRLKHIDAWSEIKEVTQTGEIYEITHE